MNSGSIRLDVASAYLLTAARVGAWALVSALVYRRLGQVAFGVLALIRATAGLLSYTSLGLAPAMVRFLAEADKPQTVRPVPVDSAPRASEGQCEATVLDYAAPAADPALHGAAESAYASGRALAGRLALLGFVLASGYALLTEVFHPGIPPALVQDAAILAFSFGIGIVVRMMSEVPASLLQVRGRIALDNLIQGSGEAAWLIGSAVLLSAVNPGLRAVGVAFAAANCWLLLARTAATAKIRRDWNHARGSADRKLMRGLLGFGLAVTLAQAADFLYAPTDYLLIDWLLGTRNVAVYAPAVLIDAGLLLIVAALANVLLPRVAVANATGDVGRVRAYYVRGTLAGVAALSCAAVAVWLASPLLLRVWLGSDLPETRALLPWVLVHTVVGGSGAVGRSVLLGMGKVKPFTAAVIVAGVANVLLSYTFVRFFKMGLHGIVLGTIVVVVARSAIWMPWYVLRTLSRSAAGPPSLGESGKGKSAETLATP